MIPDLSAMPTPALASLGIALLLQITLAVISLVVLARTPRERLVFGKKWPWVLIIVLVNFIGAILFFAIGRRP
ncbi:MAG: PLDc N-terminal domain-containing protein, partial [Rhodococcus sp. (in: high G+C Gram-positive bacteria)]